MQDPLTGVWYYPHYWSTYCQHDRHEDCRLTCKTCDEPCRCPCHHTTRIDGSDMGAPDGSTL